MADKKSLSLADIEALADVQLENWDATADANAGLPPIPQGEYLFNVRHLALEDGNYWEAKESGKKGGYMSTQVVLTVAENPLNPEEYWGRKITVRNIMTMLMEQTRTTGVQALAQGLGKGNELANGPQSEKHMVLTLTKALMGEPLVGAVIDWEASFYDKTATNPETGQVGYDLYPQVRGMKRFPQDAKGNYIPRVPSSDGVMEAEARNFVRRWITLKDLTTKKQGKKVEEQGEDEADTVAVPAAPAAPKAPVAPVAAKKVKGAA